MKQVCRILDLKDVKLNFWWPTCHVFNMPWEMGRAFSEGLYHIIFQTISKIYIKKSPPVNWGKILLFVPPLSLEVLRMEPQGLDIGGNFLLNPLNHLMPIACINCKIMVGLNWSTAVLLYNVSTSFTSVRSWKMVDTDSWISNRLVGDVACTGKHTWVFFNNFFTREFDSNLVPDVRI